MRNPSLHILKSDFVKVLASCGVKDAEALASEVMRKAVPYHVKNRSMVRISSTAVAKKVEKVVQASSGVDVAMFNRILTEERISMGHKRIRPVRKGDPDYGMMREIAEMASEFIKMFELEKEEGIRIYCSIGLNIMGKKYALNKFKYYDRYIHEQAESISTIQDDEKPEDTKEMRQVYIDALVQFAGVEEKFDTPDKFVHFVYAREDADKVGANYSVWVVAQFQALAFLDTVPELSQLYGEKAIDRYKKYTRELKQDALPKKQKKEEDEGRVVKSKTETDYFERLRNMKNEKAV